MSRPNKYSNEFIQAALDRRAAGELIEDIAREYDMEGTTLSKLINRRHGYIRKKHYHTKKDFALLSEIQKKTINNMYRRKK